jgi:hypothetical protein
MVEFCLAGIASVTMLISTVSLCFAMWNYHTLAFAIHEATRYAAVRGKGCTYPGNTCSVTVDNIAHKIATNAIGVPPGSVNVTLTTDSGAATSCNPLNSCYGNATVWPPGSNSDNRIGKNITISAKYHVQTPLVFFWPGAGSQGFRAIWFPASSTQKVLF